MKKLLVLFLIFTITLSFDVFALEYKTVNISTTFSEDIEFSDVEKVKLTFFGEGIDYVDDASSIINIVELTKENNYSQTINNVKIVDKSNLFAIVDKDNYGSYNCDISLDTSVVDIANINILISKNNLQKNEYTTIPSDIIDKIIGTNEENRNENNSSNNNDENNNDSENNTSDSSDNEIIVGMTTTTTTTTKIYKEELKKRQEQEEKEKVKKKNNMISLALFAILGIIFVIALLFVMYKFVTANK